MGYVSLWRVEEQSAYKCTLIIFKLDNSYAGGPKSCAHSAELSFLRTMFCIMSAPTSCSCILVSSLHQIATIDSARSFDYLKAKPWTLEALRVIGTSCEAM